MMMIYFQYDSSTPLRVSAPAQFIHEKFRAGEGPSMTGKNRLKFKNKNLVNF
jgi:hypothetical protein